MLTYLLTYLLAYLPTQDDEAVDIDYWHTVQRQLVLAKAKGVVRKTSESMCTCA